MSSSSLALRARGVEFGYPIRLGLARSRVLAGVDLELARGRTLGLAGPTGAGKSTFLRLAAGLDAPTKGELQVLGGSCADASVRARVGYLPEDAAFPRELTVFSALRLLGALQGMDRRACRAAALRLLEIVGLGDRADTRLLNCSRGMLRRFGLAQAWLHGPDLVLLDEPTAGLDALGFEVMSVLLEEARRSGATVVLASHANSDLTDHCDEMVVLLGGRVALAGDPREVLGRRSLTDVYRSHAHASTPA